MSEPLVAVLLSAYNGERYLAEQLDSLARQTHRNIRVIVRDDGSTDGTRLLIERYTRLGDRLHFLPGENIGLVASFFALLDRAPTEAAYFCFCDQDDVWREDKIERGVRSIERRSGPAMSFAGMELVDAQLRPLRLLADRAPRGAGLENALVESVASGCTITLNAAAWRVLRGRERRLADIGFHDWWAYLAISAVGEVVADRYAALKYRQHAANEVGTPGGLARWRRRWTRTSGYLSRQAAELLSVHGADMPSERRRLVADFIAGVSSPSAVARARYALRTPTYRQRRVDDVALRLAIAAGRL